jgi:hypothetical protein
MAQCRHIRTKLNVKRLINALTAECIPFLRLSAVSMYASTLVVALGCFSLPTSAEDRPRRAILKSTDNYVWASIDVLKAVSAATKHMEELYPNITDFKPRNFSTYFLEDRIYVHLDQFSFFSRSSENRILQHFGFFDKFRIENKQENSVAQFQLPSAYFLIDRNSFQVLKFDLCTRECGIFRVPWFESPPTKNK